MRFIGGEVTQFTGADVTGFFEESGGQIVTRGFILRGDPRGDRLKTHPQKSRKIHAPAAASVLSRAFSAADTLIERVCCMNQGVVRF